MYRYNNKPYINRDIRKSIKFARLEVTKVRRKSMWYCKVCRQVFISVRVNEEEHQHNMEASNKLIRLLPHYCYSREEMEKIESYMEDGIIYLNKKTAKEIIEIGHALFVFE